MNGEFTQSAEDELIERETIFDLREAISSLTPKQQLVVQLRYGFWDGTLWSQEKVAERMNISHQAVSRIEERALHNLRNSGVAERD